MNMTLVPIGTVRKEEGEPVRLMIKPEYWEATLRIEEFSHIHVIWWASELDTPETRAVLSDIPPTEGAKLSGVFASRSPYRPNPVLLSIVRLESVDHDKTTLVVDQIDANDGTPIVDIKPYMPSSDRVDNARVAPWFSNLIKRYTK